MKEGPLVQMLDRQRVQQAAADEAKKLVDAAALASERLVTGPRGSNCSNTLRRTSTVLSCARLTLPEASSER